ncbi:EAL domain-containing response regulator [Tychonema sp. LEGE 07199]|uniref:EAL domain-containing response regulator n=1 Tax=unclassified Tychonema TaxID=2642144 RepID=UPI00188208E6|nr:MULTISPECIES: EAL domain-containing response regulator [unclassified Tychonema]MBE9121669.1 EAL domain-containing response regulator [Tychonema sp. LEGE 07199]MBE9133758.1 EAL domain-containing response regulator [Tychonema sp. LEGE 07196]
MKKILVIEDDRVIRENILKLLKAEGFDVTGAENGALGLNAAVSSLPDVILCDVMMPELDGYGVLMALRSHPVTATVPFVFLTGKAERSEMRQGMELGADDYLTKPFTKAELVGAISSRLKKQAAFAEQQHNLRSRSSTLLPDAADKLEEIETSLRAALEREEFQVYYQPQVNVQTGKIVSAEALVRWLHPEKGLISPAEFIPDAEATGFIIQLGEWVLQTACRQIQVWQNAGFALQQVAVNLSPAQFHQPELSSRVAEILAEIGLAPSSLELELTESLMVEDAEGASATLQQLKDLGVSISIDDFGTGYSSLSYLTQYPFDVLKIDRCFISNITDGCTNAAIVKAIIEMAHSLCLEVIAEGVETEAEKDFLWRYECDAMQGYLFSPPVPAADFEQLLAEGK